MKYVIAVITFLFAVSLLGQTPVHHYEYVVTDQAVYVYDIDNAGALVKTDSVMGGRQPRGAAASAVTGKLYIAFGGDGQWNGNGGQLALDLATDTVTWTKSYSHGIDSQAITPDGTQIFMPDGELSTDSTWYVEDAATGNDVGTISAGSHGPHNTIVNNSGTRVYMGQRDYALAFGSAGTNDFAIADSKTLQVLQHVTPTRAGVRPFVINSAETLVYFADTSLLGFQVGSLATGNVLYTVTLSGVGIPGFTTSYTVTCPSHGIALSNDDKTLYVIDQPNSYVHVFDVSNVPASAPVQIGLFPLPDKINGTQQQCAYDCEEDSWLNLSRDNKYLFVGDTQDVINTATGQVAMKMSEIANTRIFIEVDFQGSVPIWAMGSRFSYGGSSGQTTMTGMPPVPPTNLRAQ